MKAEICDGRIILAAGLDPGVAVRALDDLVGDQLGVLLGDRIVEAAADQALDREDVLSGLVTAWRLAGWPIRRSPSLVKGDDRRRRARAFRYSR
jgi:hypothetical protein